MKNFQIVNPVIKGSMETNIRAKTARDAAITSYKNISTYFASNVPQFAFTLQEGGNLSHFVASEKINSEGKVKFTIRESKKIQNIELLNKFINETDNFEGGGHKRRSKSRYRYRYEDDSSDSSDSSSDSSSDYNYYKPVRHQTPIEYWYYYPNAYKYNYYYVPQFISPITPYIEIRIDIPP